MPLIDLKSCYPRVEEQEDWVRQHLLAILEEKRNDFAMPRVPQGTVADLEALRPSLILENTAADMALTASGQSALTVALLTLCSSKVQVAVEEWTFPHALALLRQIGVKTTILAMDEQGLIPEAFEAACKAGIQVLYTMPTLHNPLGITMPLERRKEIISIAERYGIFIVEDEAYASLDSSGLPALQSFLPNQTVRMASLSKIFSLSLRLGAVIYPPALSEHIVPAMRMTGSMANPIMTATAARMAQAGIMEVLIQSKKQEGMERQRCAKAIFKEGYKAHPSSWYGMLEVPVSGLKFAERARNAGIILSSGSEYRADGEDRLSLRVSLGGEASLSRLARGLEIVERLRQQG